MRGKFDVTALVHPGAKNALAVRIEKNATPGSVKEKTLQSPTRTAARWARITPLITRPSAGIGFPRFGAGIGHLGDVYLTTSGAGDDENPLVTTTLPLPDTTSADVSIEATLRQPCGAPVSGTLRGKFGDAAFEMPVNHGRGSGEDGEARPIDHGGAAPGQSETLVAGRIWRARISIRVELSFVTAAAGFGRESVPGRRAAVHL